MFRSGYLAACLLAVAYPALARTWNDTEGHTVEGEFVHVVKGKVVINVSGRMIQVPFGHLVEDDQDFVREQLEAKGLGSQLPAKKKPESDSAADAGSNGKETAAANEPKPGPERKWTDISGRSIQARFIGIENANVVLKFKGKRTSFPFDKFSLADQGYVRTEMTGRGEGDKVPSEVAVAIAQPVPAAPQFVQTHPTAPPYQPPPYQPPPYQPPPYQPPPYQSPPYQPPPRVAQSFPAPVQSPPVAPMQVPEMTPSIPSSQQVMGKVCSKCGALLPANITAGDSCPKCGTYFSYDNTNGKTAHWGYYATPAGLGTVIAVVVGLIARARRKS